MSTIATLDDIQKIIKTNLFFQHGGTKIRVLIRDTMGGLEIGLERNTFTPSKKHPVFFDLTKLHVYLKSLKKQRQLTD